MQITKIVIKATKRGYPISNGRRATKFLVKLGENKTLRRVYDRCASPNDGKRKAVFVPIVRGLDGEFRDLTTEESAEIGYHFHTCRLTLSGD